MAYKTRTESKELMILRVLNKRMILPENDQQHFYSLKKGYEGEVLFDTLTDKLQCECYILNDLLLRVNNTTFQIDTLIIISRKILLYEVKNFEGDYYYKSDQFFAINGTEIQNPLDQIKRSDTLLRQVFQKKKYSISIKSNVFFVNPAFTLYQAPLDKPIIYPTQLTRYLEELNARPSILTDNHYKLAEDLVKEHKPCSPYTRLPPYTYEDLKKGLTCSSCFSFLVKAGETKIVCSVCGCMENIEDGILRSVRELQLLFPNIKITTNLIFEWCKVIESRKQIRRILKIHFKAFRRGKYTYYE